MGVEVGLGKLRVSDYCPASGFKQRTVDITILKSATVADFREEIAVHQPGYDRITLKTKEEEVRKSFVTLRLKIAQKPYMVWSLGPQKTSRYESLLEGSK